MQCRGGWAELRLRLTDNLRQVRGMLKQASWNGSVRQLGRGFVYKRRINSALEPT